MVLRSFCCMAGRSAGPLFQSTRAPIGPRAPRGNRLRAVRRQQDGARGDLRSAASRARASFTLDRPERRWDEAAHPSLNVVA